MDELLPWTPELARALLRAYTNAAKQDGMSDVDAARAGLRRARLVFYRNNNWSQRDAADDLGVTTRTLRSDEARAEADQAGESAKQDARDFDHVVRVSRVAA